MSRKKNLPLKVTYQLKVFLSVIIVSILTLLFYYFQTRQAVPIARNLPDVSFNEEPAKVISGWETFYTLDYAIDYPPDWKLLEGPKITNKKDNIGNCVSDGEGVVYVNEVNEGPYGSSKGLDRATEEEFYSLDYPYWARDKKYVGNGGLGQREVALATLGGKKVVEVKINSTVLIECPDSSVPSTRKEYYVRLEKKVKPIVYNISILYKTEDVYVEQKLQQILSTLRFAR